MLMFPSQEHLVLAIKIRWQINSVWMTYHRRKLSSELDANAGDRLLNCGKQPSGLMCYSVQNLRESSLIAGSPLLLSLRQNPLPIARGAPICIHVSFAGQHIQAEISAPPTILHLSFRLLKCFRYISPCTSRSALTMLHHESHMF